MRFRFTVIVDAPSHSDAEQVVSERLDMDEDYGFPYALEWSYDSAIDSGYTTEGGERDERLRSLD